MNRTNLVSFVHIGIVNSDIEVFNQYVLENSQALKNHTHDINKDDMLGHLLDAYFLAQDNEFHAYIFQLKTMIDDGTLTQTAEQLMGKAFNFYKSHKDKGTWGQQSWSSKDCFCQQRLNNSRVALRSATSFSTSSNKSGKEGKAKWKGGYQEK